MTDVGEPSQERIGWWARLRRWWAGKDGDPPTVREAAPPDANWETNQLSPETRRVGVACSGGGIRSASFTLGALQAIDESTENHCGLDEVDYVAAVSGGGYTAGGWAVTSDANRPSAGGPQPEPRIFAQGSPEEERLRRNSSLVPNIRTGAAAFGRTTMGLAVNLLLLWGLMIAVAAPVGWITSAQFLHPELRARTPLLQIEQQPRTVRSTSFPAENEVPETIRFEEISDLPCSTGLCRAWKVVGLDWTTPEVAKTELDGDSETVFPPLVCDLNTPTQIVLDAGVLSIAQQPRVILPTTDEELAELRAQAAGAQEPGNTENACAEIDPDVEVIESGGAVDESPALSVDRQPELSIRDTAATEPTKDLLRVDSDPVIAQRSGFSGRPPATHSSAMHAAAVVTVSVALLAGLLRIISRPTTAAATHRWRVVVRVASAVAAIAVTFIYVVPWIIVSVPPFIQDLPSWLPILGGEQLSGSSLVNTTAVAFLLTLVETGLRLLRSPAKKAIRRWPIRVARVATVAFLALVVIAVLADILQVAAANGPRGHLSDFILQPTFTAEFEFFGYEVRLSVSDIGRWLIVLFLLWVWNRVADAHSWSLYPFYKRWISRAFVSARSDRVVNTDPKMPTAPTPSEPVNFAQPTRWVGDPPNEDDVGLWARLGSPTGGAQLITCCAVNLHDTNAAPSGRKAGTFVFSSDHIGGPDVGWMKTKDYWAKLPHSRRKDLTVVATMAISGAAFSPGMGKMSMGPLGGLMALVNARLGVWVPHPRAVAELQQQQQWRGRPGWVWWFREVIQRFNSNARYLYVSDGGHWENLGVIELLRRGCNQVYVISAAGDGVDGFSTVGEAIALAREELGIEIEGLDLDDLRAPRGEAGPDDHVLVHSDGTTTRFAERSFSVGTLRRVGTRKPYGVIVVVEANLSRGMPWDVQAHAEKHKEFPNDSTLNQFFDYRQFESYRRLGQLQTSRALAKVPVDVAETDPATLLENDDWPDEFHGDGSAATGEPTAGA